LALLLGQRRDADRPVDRPGAVPPPQIGHQAGRLPAWIGFRRHVYDQPAVVRTEIAVGVESALDGLRVAEPGPVQADQAWLDHEAAEQPRAGSVKGRAGKPPG